MIRFASPLVTTVLCLGLVGPVFAAELRVPSEYSTIQSAIDAASDGDVVLVAAGTYAEALDFSGKAIRVQSESGSQETMIDASGLDTSTVSFENGEGPDSELVGFTITGGDGRSYAFQLVGGGLYLHNCDPTIRDCHIVANHADTGGGAWLLSSNAAFVGCTFRSNVVNGSGDGGGGIYATFGNPTLTSCLFLDNFSGYDGGGIKYINSNPVVANCGFHRNRATFGGGATNLNADASYVNCTFAGNIANDMWETNGGGLRAFSGGEIQIDNCIFHGNTPSQIIELGSLVVVNNSLVQDGWDGQGEGNLDADPMFVDPDGEDFCLQPESPCVDRGVNEALPEWVETDVDGNERIVNMLVDMGAHESQVINAPRGACCLGDDCHILSQADCLAADGAYEGDFTSCDDIDCAPPDPCPADLNGTGDVDVQDLLALIMDWGSCANCPADLDGDGMVNVIDLLAMLAAWGDCPQ
jgi:hypothetical protein